MSDEDAVLRAEVERRLRRPFATVQDQLCELFGRDWDDVETFVATSATKKERSEADVICDLVAKAEEKTPATTVVRRAVVRFIGKPWRERENPWDKYKGRVPTGAGVPADPPPTAGEGLPWVPPRPDE